MAKVTLVISLDAGTDDDLLAVALLDDELNVDAQGETQSQFAPGDMPYFLVHLDPALAVRGVSCSSGSCRYLGQVVRTAAIDSLDVDADGDTTELEYIPASEPVFAWYGNRPAVSREGRVLTFSGALPAAGSATYTYQALSYQYRPPPLEPTQEWRTRIVIHVGAA